MSYRIDLTGQRFGMLTVLRFSHIEPPKSKKHIASPGKGNRYWVCRCDCGTEKPIAYHLLTRRDVPALSCGCQKGTKGMKFPNSQKRHGAKL